MPAGILNELDRKYRGDGAGESRADFIELPEAGLAMAERSGVAEAEERLGSDSMETVCRREAASRSVHILSRTNAGVSEGCRDSTEPNPVD